MVTLAQLVSIANPKAAFSPNGNIVLVDNGNGPRITYWDEAELGPKPEWDEATQTYPALEVFRAQAEALQAAHERLSLYPSAESYQVRAWMIRGDLDPDAVPQIISQVITDAKEKKEALMRWDYAVKIPRDFPLVDIIGSQMNLTPMQIDAAWADILKI